MNSTLKTIVLKISGMHCTACALNIDLDLEEIPGIKSSQTSYAKQQTAIEFDPTLISLDHILEVIKNTGYQALPGS